MYVRYNHKNFYRKTINAKPSRVNLEHAAHNSYITTMECKVTADMLEADYYNFMVWIRLNVANLSRKFFKD